jgi:hypothetical protein
LNIDAASARSRESNISRGARRRFRSRFRGSAANLRGPKKEKPGGGNAGSDIFVIGVYGFKYAAWLSFLPLESGESILFLLYSQCFFLVLLFSCSSLTFLNLTEPFAKSHRFLSVLRTHSSLVGTHKEKQDRAIEGLVK